MIILQNNQIIGIYSNEELDTIKKDLFYKESIKDILYNRLKKIIKGFK